ncbi:MAG: hypothetical protein MZV70_70790 [Desulfobacterales bacterium]|nr:hypothetical protein [Desulfobacterales bacterium]
MPAPLDIRVPRRSCYPQGVLDAMPAGRRFLIAGIAFCLGIFAAVSAARPLSPP